MNIFDKICAVLGFLLGTVFLLLGAFGLFFGCNAHFTLPPIVGALPLLFGWGIVKPIVVAWKSTHPPNPSFRSVSTTSDEYPSSGDTR